MFYVFILVVVVGHQYNRFPGLLKFHKQKRLPACFLMVFRE